jgi:hypothetical protein
MGELMNDIEYLTNLFMIYSSIVEGLSYYSDAVEKSIERSIELETANTSGETNNALKIMLKELNDDLKKKYISSSFLFKIMLETIGSNDYGSLKEVYNELLERSVSNKKLTEQDQRSITYCLVEIRKLIDEKIV